MDLLQSACTPVLVCVPPTESGLVLGALPSLDDRTPLFSRASDHQMQSFCKHVALTNTKQSEKATGETHPFLIMRDKCHFPIGSSLLFLAPVASA